MAGNVYVDGKKQDKAGLFFPPDVMIELHGPGNPYVSRGGMKLRKALKEFAVDLRGKTVLDVGASTGGFTDCALEHGARKVYALDVGYGQLAWELRNDPRVVVMERFNVRFLKEDDLTERPYLAVIDVSFISLKLVLPVIAGAGIAEIICLVKPQFEARPEQVGKKGVIREQSVHREVLEELIIASKNLSYDLKGLTYSPLKGPQGNIEYFLYLQKNRANKEMLHVEETLPDIISRVVMQAHEELR